MAPRLSSAQHTKTSLKRNMCLSDTNLLLQPLRWHCVECVIDHEQDVREEQ